MRRSMLLLAALTPLVLSPTLAQAQAATAAGAGTGALAGAVVGGPIGAAVGGVIGGVVGASAERPRYRAVRAPKRTAVRPQRSSGQAAAHRPHRPPAQQETRRFRPLG
ncbi:hypothetical protein [Microvirga thermotolerans]|uniref:Glycine zipper domain-containing protein n=1 Tax=Microvirga thermotolerans TaxID=2651334 RepID=A0A5P9JRW3_9HYPH|nr:hypothetical protein [Microvirga thermotolerans]QFU14841.1 hypothetical protein GDR74_00660 [Microvirga thermotolerans]